MQVLGPNYSNSMWFNFRYSKAAASYTFILFIGAVNDNSPITGLQVATPSPPPSGTPLVGLTIGAPVIGWFGEEAQPVSFYSFLQLLITFSCFGVCDPELILQHQLIKSSQQCSCLLIRELLLPVSEETLDKQVSTAFFFAISLNFI